MKKRRVPLRKCIACNEQFPKNELLRIVVDKDEGVMVDISGKKNGRGAYLCKNIECAESIAKSSKLQSALRTNVEDGIYEQILNTLRSSKQ